MLRFAEIKRICAWCKKDMGTIEGDCGDEALNVTHGICDECAEKMRKDIGK